MCWSIWPAEMAKYRNRLGLQRDTMRDEMNALQGTIKNGYIVLDVPTGLPEGTRVEVLPLPGTQASCGMREEDWPTTPEGIAKLLARMDQVEPGWLSPEDEEAWQSALRAQKVIEKKAFDADAERLRKGWE
jgi:hypothetical protein